MTVEKGTLVWLGDKELVWKCVELTSNFEENQSQIISYKNEDGSFGESKITSAPLLRNPEILIGQNDLTSLSYLHEPAVLFNLKQRFSLNNTIYTYCGIVLVAINPYEEIDIYNQETIQAYRGMNWGELDPHIFAVAEEAYTKMERDNRDQSIIVSGESGAGKTVSAKYAMRYFATVGGSENETKIEKKVLASSPIMEAIGNAKTTRNDNSSRFGKYVELEFNKKYSITGASMRTYLLEKSRVVYQSESERNYHIFYQLCASGKSHPELSELFLESSENYNYTKGGSGDLNDVQNFNETVEAMVLLGFGVENRRNFFKIIAAVLQLGNFVFVSNSEVANLQKDNASLCKFSTLLQVDSDVLRKRMVTRRITSGREEIVKQLSVQESIYSRDALAKLLYSELFNWIVNGINETLSKENQNVVHKFIGVLDIYGFETFENNSFEQFCINYANEKLQQQFNQHVFKLEQEEYIREGIDWKFIDFSDNQPCIDLIELKLGILDLLDEECRMPNGSDASWVIKLQERCKTNKHFIKPKIGGAESFLVKHFADDVCYTAGGFIEKNRDSLPGELVQAVIESKNLFLSELFKKNVLPIATQTMASKGQTKGVQKRGTVGSQFIESLKLLMSSLNLTTPHYVRCIKPNDLKLPFVFDPHRAVQQLRACGVLETIRISAAGFPSRWSYSDFHARYRMLIRNKNNKNLHDNCRAIIEVLIKNEDMYRFGKSKLFFRAGQVAFLEKVRLEKLQASGLIVQKLIRGWARKNRYMKIKKSAALLQKHGRGMMARKRARNLRETRAVIVLQKNYRRWSKMREFNIMKSVIIKMQARGRGFLARARARYLRETRAVIVLQKHLRGVIARNDFKSRVGKVIIAQSAVRRYLARKRFKGLKLEARSLEHIKNLNKGLENKIISLQQKIEAINKENLSNKLVAKEIEVLKINMAEFKNMEKEVKNLNKKIDTLEKSNGEIGLELEKERIEKVDFVNQIDKKNGEIEILREEIEKWGIEKEKLKGEIEILKIQVQRGGGFEEKVQNLEKELEEERTKYQNLIGRSFLKDEGELKSSPVAAPRSSLSELSRLRSALESSESARKLLEQKSDSLKYTQDQIRLQDLEMENSKLRSDLNKLRVAGSGDQEIIKQFEALQDELARKREESIQLRTVLAYGPEKNDQDNEDEINVVIKGQKMIISELERNLLELQGEKDRLLESVPSSLNSEITRLTSENRELRSLITTPLISDLKDSDLGHQLFRKKSRNYLGMLEYKLEDQKRIIRSIILDLQPAVALTTITGLPAFIVFMMIRYTDYLNDDDRVRSLLMTAILNVKKVVVKKGENNVQVVVLWLTNILRLLHTLKQYSGDTTFQVDNTQAQNEQALKNFDLSEYRQLLSDHAVWVYMILIKNLEDSIQSLIVPAVLENKGIGVEEKRSSEQTKPLETLTRQLDQTYNLLTSFGLDLEVIHQIFKQIFYYICAGALNNLLLRRELCHWEKAIEIRFNVSTLEEWCRGKELENVMETLCPVVQASHLLQARKSDNDVDSLCAICDKLSVPQVVKLLNLYSSKDGLDTDKVSKTLIAKVQEKLVSMRETPTQTKSSLLMDTKFSFAVKFPFNPSNVKLEEIIIPDNYGVNQLLKRL